MTGAGSQRPSKRPEIARLANTPEPAVQHGMGRRNSRGIRDLVCKTVTHSAERRPYETSIPEQHTSGGMRAVARIRGYHCLAAPFGLDRPTALRAPFAALATRSSFPLQ